MFRCCDLTGEGSVSWPSECRKHSPAKERENPRFTVGPTVCLSGDTALSLDHQGLKIGDWTAPLVTCADAQVTPVSQGIQHASFKDGV